MSDAQFLRSLELSLDDGHARLEIISELRRVAHKLERAEKVIEAAREVEEHATIDVQSLRRLQRALDAYDAATKKEEEET